MDEAKLMFLNKEEEYIFDKFAKQTNGSVYYKKWQ